jgi:hypothetical protein
MIMDRTLTSRETAYAVAALRIALDGTGRGEIKNQADRDAMEALMLRLTGTIETDDDVKRAIDR